MFYFFGDLHKSRCPSIRMSECPYALNPSDMRVSLLSANLSSEYLFKRVSCDMNFLFCSSMSEWDNMISIVKYYYLYTFNNFKLLDKIFCLNLIIYNIIMIIDNISPEISAPLRVRRREGGGLPPLLLHSTFTSSP